MREGSRNEKSKQSVGNILLSSQRMTCNGPVSGAASSDSIRFCSSFVSLRLICPFVFSWSILTLSSSTSTCPQTWLQVVLDVSSHCQARIWCFPSSSAPSLVFQPPILRFRGHSRYLPVSRLFFFYAGLAIVR